MPTQTRPTWQAGGFGVTRWSLILAAAQGRDSTAGVVALEELCGAYWYPVYAFVRRSGFDRPDAEDLTQEFFSRLLSKRLLGAANPGKGRFRSYLLGAIRHFLANERDRARTLKRGGGQAVLSLDAAAEESRRPLEPAHDLTPEKLFERQWTYALLDRVLVRLEAEYIAEGRAGLFAALRDFLTGGQISGAAAEIAARLNVSEGSLKVTIHRLRRRYRELLRAEIAQTVSGPREVDEEIRRLFAAFE